MINLHVHSKYSLRDSIIDPDELATRLIEIGQDAVAITDHGGSLGGVSIYKTLKKAGIKYIHGCEFYICDDTSIKDKDNRYYHLVALCKNDTGRLNLNRLISISEHPDNKYFKPRIDFGKLKQHSEGLIILSACMAGEICRNLASGNYEKAKEIALKYKFHFGDDYFLEIQSRNESEQIKFNKEIARLSSETEIGCVVTTDAHYVLKEDAKYQNKYAFNGTYKEDGEAYIDCYVQSESDVRNNLKYLGGEFVEKLIQNTHTISDLCNVEIPLSAPIMPDIEIPKQYATSKEWLQDICESGLKDKVLAGEISEQHDEYLKRYNYELDSLDRMGFIDYILLVYTYASVGKRRGIARGSGGGSLVCYLAGITKIDPIEHGLYFERFIDVSALDLLKDGTITKSELKVPDIDLDFSSDSCEEILKFLRDKYGADKVASIGKFGNNHTKGTIRDMCKVLDIGLEDANTIAKAFDSYEIEDIDLMIAEGLDAPQNAQAAIKYVTEYPELFEYVRKLNGLPKSFGLHACGKVISTLDLDLYLPSRYDDNGIRCLQGDMHDVEDVGLVKADVLGLRTLDQEYDTLEMSGETIDFINPKQSYTDEKTLDIFRKGDTLGIFQMSSFGMRQTLKKMNVSGIEDIAIANALYRPGAMAYIDNFCNRRSGKEQFEYLHPDLEPILKNTYGIIVYQEQLIEIGRLAGLRNPDLLRKFTGKKNIEILNKVKPELESKLKQRGWTDEQYERLLADIISFARYSFNKSHASAYGIIAYMTAKQKAYYPAEFFAGLCNSYIGHSAYVKDEAAEIFSDICNHKITLDKFSFHNDHRRCSVVGGKIVYGIPLIKDCNTTIAEELYSLRESRYDSFVDLLLDLKKTSINKSQLSILIKLNYFQDLNKNSNKLLRIVDIFNLFYKNKKDETKQIKKEKIDNEVLYEIIKKHSTDVNAKGEELKSFTLGNVQAILQKSEDYINSLDIKDFTFEERIKFQKEYLGFVCPSQNEDERRVLLVNDVYPLLRKKDGKRFGQSIITTSIGSGKKSRFTLFDRDKTEEIKTGDLIRCINHKTDGEYFTLLEYRHM